MYVWCVFLARRRKFWRRRFSGFRFYCECVDVGCFLFCIDYVCVFDDGVYKIICCVGGVIECECVSDGGVGFEVFDDASRARRFSAR